MSQHDNRDTVWSPPPNAVVCSEHFVATDFMWQWGRKLIKPDAEPTVFPVNSSCTKKIKLSADCQSSVSLTTYTVDCAVSDEHQHSVNSVVSID